MFGFDPKTVKKNEASLPIFVHSLQSAAAFELVQKVWNVNASIRLVDQANGKEFERFSFTTPACAVWLQHDVNRSDTFELIVVWSPKEGGLTEVYTISALAGTLLGDDTRAKQLLEKMLVTPATVPVIQQQNQPKVQ